MLKDIKEQSCIVLVQFSGMYFSAEQYMMYCIQSIEYRAQCCAMKLVLMQLGHVWNLTGETAAPALHCTELHYTVLHCTELFYNALHCTALHCNTLHYKKILLIRQNCCIFWH